MVKSEVEKAIAEQVSSIFAMYKKYNPTGEYLNITILDGETIMFWDREHTVNYYGKIYEV